MTDSQPPRSARDATTAVVGMAIAVAEGDRDRFAELYALERLERQDLESVWELVVVAVHVYAGLGRALAELAGQDPAELLRNTAIEVRRMMPWSERCASKAGPATSSASGAAVTDAVIIVVMTFGRTAGGGRKVKRGWMLGFASPLAMPDATNAVTITQAGAGAARMNSGAA